ncbi:MAG: hypothetical protein HN402_07950 [Candidatus Scalindua sp.]|jgi:hypothetical protein|nr:hypothetical protein [Candidatus Scalindua sp.]MBT6757789.1 hypothetical protein [Candidatus Jacksonbacteria bacterium]
MRKKSIKYQVDYTLGKSIKVRSQIVLAKSPKLAEELLMSLYKDATIDKVAEVREES